MYLWGPLELLWEGAVERRQSGVVKSVGRRSRFHPLDEHQHLEPKGPLINNYIIPPSSSRVN